MYSGANKDFTPARLVDYLKLAWTSSAWTSSFGIKHKCQCQPSLEVITKMTIF